jgi:hypothetical protein
MMHGQVDPQGSLFSYFSAEERIPVDHPLRAVKVQADGVLEASRFTVRRRNNVLHDYLRQAGASSRFLCQRRQRLGRFERDSTRSAAQSDSGFWRHDARYGRRDQSDRHCQWQRVVYRRGRCCQSDHGLSISSALATPGADAIGIDSLQIAAVPEPSQAVLMLAGLACLFAFRRRLTGVAGSADAFPGATAASLR